MAETLNNPTRSPNEIMTSFVKANAEAAKGKMGLDDLATQQTSLAMEMLDAGDIEKAFQMSLLGGQTLNTFVNVEQTGVQKNVGEGLIDGFDQFKRSSSALIEGMEDSTRRMGNAAGSIEDSASRMSR